MRLRMTTALMVVGALTPHFLAPSAWAQTAAAAQEEGPDILFLALVTTAAAVGAAIVGLVFYLIRLRLGFWLHRPPPREGGEAPGHH